MYKVKITMSAQNDISNIASFILADSGDGQTAFDYILIIEKAIMSLNEFPDRGSIPRYRLLKLQGYRFLTVKNHLVFYKSNESLKEVVVYRVLHHKTAYQSII